MSSESLIWDERNGTRLRGGVKKVLYTAKLKELGGNFA